MSQRPFRVLAVLALVFFLPTAANAQFTHTAPTTADLVFQEGSSHTVVVQIVNLTPYEIYFHSNSNTIHDETDQNRNTKKSLAFAPLGVPQYIPSPPLQAQMLLPNGEKNPAYDSTYVNDVTRPHSMVFSWDDRGGYVEQTWVTWTIKGVYCRDTRCPVQTQDVDLGLFLTRNKPTVDLTAGYYWKLIRTILTRAVSCISLVVDPLDPFAWIHFFLGTGEVVMEEVDFNNQQKEAADGEKLYVAVFPIPDVNTACYGNPKCDPSVDSESDDGVYAEWAPGVGGFTQEEIVVTTHVLRGIKAGKSGCKALDSHGSLGTLPVAMVTVMTLDEWLLSNLPTLPSSQQAGLKGVSSGADLIRSILQQYGREGLRALLSIIGALPHEQRNFLRDLISSRRAGNPLTPQQEAFIHMIAVRLRNQVK